MKLFFTFLSGFTFFISTCQIVPNGLQGYWPFDGDALDYSPNNNHGTPYNGAYLSQDRFGVDSMAYCFDGTDDYIETLYPGILGTGSRTITFWGKIHNGNTVDGTGQVVMSWGESTASVPGGTMRMILNRQCMGIGMDVSEAAFIHTNSIPSLDVWHFFAIIFDHTQNGQLGSFTMYVDGAPLTTAFCHNYNTTTTVNTLTGEPIYFGRLFLNSSPRNFKGCLDEIRMYDRELSRSELDSIFHAENLGNGYYDSDVSMSVFPNPAREFVYLTSGENEWKELQIAVTDIAGRVIYSQEQQGTVDEKIYISHLAPGYYFINLVSGSKIIASRKFLKI